MTRRGRWLIPAAALPVFALLAYGFTVDHRAIPSPLLDRPAANFALTSYTGEPMTLEAHLGRVVVLNFWASWCYPACYEEAPVLERGWRAYKDRGVVVLGVPETFFIDAKGRIRAKHVGAVTDEVFRREVNRLLAERGA